MDKNNLRVKVRYGNPRSLQRKLEETARKSGYVPPATIEPQVPEEVIADKQLGNRSRSKSTMARHLLGGLKKRPAKKE